MEMGPKIVTVTDEQEIHNHNCSVSARSPAQSCKQNTPLHHDIHFFFFEAQFTEMQVLF